jgi:hypothetical protein
MDDLLIAGVSIVLLPLVAILLFGCESKVEIPIRHAGVVIADHEQVENQVLRPVEHVVGYGSEVIVYDVGYENLEIEFDFLFKDVTEGNLKLAIEFTTIVDSLPSFYRMYQSTYIVPVVDSKIRSIIRKFLMNYNPTELAEDELKARIIEVLVNNRDITNFAKVHQVELMDLRW